MSKYGYMIYTFRVHPHGKDATELGEFDGTQDALVVLHGILRGLMQQRVSDKDRHIHAKAVEGIGRTVKFAVSVGYSGQASEFYEPDDEDQPVFMRAERHIESNIRRGLLVVPSRSTIGLLVLEVHGRSGAKTLLAPTLSRAFRHHTDYILQVASVADETALKQFIAEAQAREITLRRSGLPTDIADAVEIPSKDASAGKLELRITPGRIKQFQQRLVSKLRGDDDTRQRLLHVHGLDFDELSIGMVVGERRTTLTVTAERVPTFIYDLPGREPPTDQGFYEEVIATVKQIAPAVGVNVAPGWDTGAWSDKAQGATLTLPAEGTTDDASATREPQ